MGNSVRKCCMQARNNLRVECEKLPSRGWIFIQPLWSFPTVIMFLVYGIWSFIVVSSELYKKTPDISGPFSILATTIAVTLPLLASAAVQRNKDSLFNYNAFCGDVLALGWESLSYVRSEKGDEDFKSKNWKLHQLFQICMVLPTAVKWKFRNNKEFDIEKILFVKVKNNEKPVEYKRSKKRRRMSTASAANQEIVITRGLKFTDTRIGGEFKDILLRMGGKEIDGDDPVGVDKCDLLFIFLFDLISEFKSTSDTRKNMLTRTVERVYSSYGNMGNISDYKIPLMYETYMYIALAIFMFAFPFTYSKSDRELINMNIEGVSEDVWSASAIYKPSSSSIEEHGYDIIWHGFIVIYFLFGMNLMTRKVSNAFVRSNDAIGYNTVGDSETLTNKTLFNMYKQRPILQIDQTLNVSSNPIDIYEGKGETVTLLTNRRKLYA